MQTQEGRAVLQGSTYHYEYNLKDHLGNVRASFDNPGTGSAREIQEDEYYAFGLRKPDYDFSNNNRYLYNGKEIQNDLTNQYDYGARFYDPAIGRWAVIDPHAEMRRDQTSYGYGSNNPILYADLMGMDTVKANSNGPIHKGDAIEISPGQYSIAGDEVTVTDTKLSKQENTFDLLVQRYVRFMSRHELQFYGWQEYVHGGTGERYDGQRVKKSEAVDISDYLNFASGWQFEEGGFSLINPEDATIMKKIATALGGVSYANDASDATVNAKDAVSKLIPRPGTVIFYPQSGLAIDVRSGDTVKVKPNEPHDQALWDLYVKPDGTLTLDSDPRHK